MNKLNLLKFDVLMLIRNENVGRRLGQFTQRNKLVKLTVSFKRNF